MAEGSGVHEQYNVHFGSDALEGPRLLVNQMHGREAIGQLFEFRLEVETGFNDNLSFDDVDQMLLLPAQISFGSAAEHAIHGVLRSVEMLPSSRPSAVNYELILVPRLWYLTQTSGSWVYTQMSVPDMLRDVLKANDLVEGDDFELRLSATYAPREYTLQYQETDFDFIARLMEHEGMFFFWDHDGGRDKLVIGDSNAVFAPLAGHESINFDTRGGTTDLPEVIVAASRKRSRIPSTLVVKEYNYRTPSLSLRTGLAVDADGRGTVVRYGDNCKDLVAAKRIAKLRAEEIYLQRELFAFTGRVRGLRAGMKFELQNHFLPEMGREYLVTAIEHRVVQYTGLTDSAGDNQGYSNSISATPFDHAYRPALRTARPRIPGFTHAKVDGDHKDDGTTPIDEMGRYKVSSVVDNTRSSTQTASHWVRRGQPYSGQGYGMHFPLHVGTEVMLIHVDGDPDRPIIVGTAPNPEHGSPVCEVDSQRSRVMTRSRLIMGWHDRRG